MSEKTETIDGEDDARAFSTAAGDAPVWFRLAKRAELADDGYAPGDIAKIEGTHPGGVVRWLRRHKPRRVLALYLTDELLGEILANRQTETETPEATVVRILRESLVIPKEDGE